MQPTLHSSESLPALGEELGGFSLSLFPPISRKSQNGASQVSDWSAMQRGFILGQVGELWYPWASSYHPL